MSVRPHTSGQQNTYSSLIPLIEAADKAACKIRRIEMDVETIEDCNLAIMRRVGICALPSGVYVRLTDTPGSFPEPPRSRVDYESAVADSQPGNSAPSSRYLHSSKTNVQSVNPVDLTPVSRQTPSIWSSAAMSTGNGRRYCCLCSSMLFDWTNSPLVVLSDHGAA